MCSNRHVEGKNVNGTPLQVSKRSKNEGAMSTRSDDHLVLNEHGATVLSKNTFINDTTHIWNRAPNSIKNCRHLTAAKQAINSFIITFIITFIIVLL